MTNSTLPGVAARAKAARQPDGEATCQAARPSPGADAGACSRAARPFLDNPEGQT